MARYQKPAPLNFAADDVWAAACQAHRLNQGYIKVSEDAPAGQTNRNLVTQYLADTSKITDEDREQGKLVRKFYQGFTFKILKGIKLSEFDNTAMLLANRETIDTNYDLAVITSLPSGYERGMKRQTVDQRIAFAKGGLIGRVTDKVSTSIEVLKSFYSQQWNTNYITGITSDDHVLFFAYKQPLEVGKMFDLYGTVKAHRDNVTQLNRVKILSVV
jgi:hypothetical protein